ncbi:hypothetical protein F5J12DRAFT_40085 [Pisolithus orientalis]|uniref:uncharacterized protein n=1 Tax=Pisolithus orientalis TaxID=936130 RepID=UPI0022243C68|nr:uncharacterized protein F5J12DRAFT_40085 [Pisolithus orientalis]KAI6009487.1 hypothetical protein F5J12DRAFT_40085 [Pisolithus orientalis]
MTNQQIEIVSPSEVYSVTFADESQVVGGHYDSNIRRWKVEDGQQQLQGPAMQTSGTVNSLVVSQDGEWMVSGDWGKKAILWNATSHEKMCELECANWALGVDISSDCTKIASAAWNNVHIFSTYGTSGIQPLPPLPHSGIVGAKFSPDDRRFATASESQGFRVYNTDNGNILFDSGQYGSTGRSSRSPLAWSSDGQQLFVAPRGKIVCFDLSKSSTSEWPIHENQSPVHIASTGRFIACAAGSSVSLWDCVSHKQIGGNITHTTEVKCVALSPSGGYLACGNGRNITIHNLRDILSPEYFHPALPLVQMSGETLKSWTQSDPTNTEMLLSEEIGSTSSPSHYMLAIRGLVRARLKHIAPAIEDVKESLRVQTSPFGHVAMAIALLGQGDSEGALCTFDLAFHDCGLNEIKFLLLLKAILVFESGNQEEAITRIEYLATRANKDGDDDATYLHTQILGVMYMKNGNYGRAIPTIERAKSLAPSYKQCPPLLTISLIFGWSFDGPDITSQQRLCETLYAEERAAEAMEILISIIRTSDEETLRSKANADWLSAFTEKCASTLEHVGNEAIGSGEHNGAGTHYPAPLPLGPSSPASLFINRSRARVARGLWEDALQDANDAVKVDASCPWGYEAKHAALHGAKRYDEAIDAFGSMLQVIEESHDPSTRELRKSYVSPSETIAAIDPIIRQILKSCPLVVIDVTTGRLCDGPERIRILKADPSFKELVSSMMKEVDNLRILRVVAKFFGYVMFSHAWQGNEPLFQDVNVAKSVWNLPDMPLNEKLRSFCKETRRLGYNWAWSDTCCIDKTTSSILNQSLTSMYKWYANSAATLVFLAGVGYPSKPGDLTHSLWMTRAWTLQELLAPKVMFFYDSEWELYLGDTSANHKESLEIMQELADAIKLPRGTIVTFSPDDLGVHEKLRLASTRSATVEEDVAYSLIGIFKSDIRPHYGEGPDALGHLLEEIVARSGEVTVLAWSGKSSTYNSCLPASISVYHQIPYNPPSLEGEEMEARVSKLRDKLPWKEVQRICNKINRLSPARFAARRLHLPCIVFPVKSLEKPRKGNEKSYRARVSGLGTVVFTTADDLPLHEPKKIVFAHPWIRHIRGPSSGIPWGGDSESDTDSESDLDAGPGSDEVVPSQIVWEDDPESGTDTDSVYHDAKSDVVGPPSPSPITVPHVDDYTRALQTIARLGQPFNALLLVQQPDGEYKRVAAENEIVVSGLETHITCKNILAKVLEIL